MPDAPLEPWIDVERRRTTPARRAATSNDVESYASELVYPCPIRPETAARRSERGDISPETGIPAAGIRAGGPESGACSVSSRSIPLGSCGVRAKFGVSAGPPDISRPTACLVPIAAWLIRPAACLISKAACRICSAGCLVRPMAHLIPKLACLIRPAGCPIYPVGYLMRAAGCPICSAGYLIRPATGGMPPGMQMMHVATEMMYAAGQMRQPAGRGSPAVGPMAHAES